MIWGRLKNVRCPKCGKDLVNKPHLRLYDCIHCEFSISYDKFELIVNRLYKRDPVEDSDKNLTELSQL